MLSKCLFLVFSAAATAQQQTTAQSYATAPAPAPIDPAVAAQQAADAANAASQATQQAAQTIQKVSAQPAPGVAPAQPGVAPAGVAPAQAAAAAAQAAAAQGAAAHAAAAQAAAAQSGPATPSYQSPVGDVLGGQAPAQSPSSIAARAGFHTNVPMGGGAGGNPMAALLSSVTQAAASGQGGSFDPNNMNSDIGSQVRPGQQYSGTALSMESQAVVSGLIESFMHKVQLEPGERQCLESNMGTLTGDIMGTVGDIVTAIKALVAGKGKVEKDATSGLVSAGIDSAMKITSLVAMSTQLVKNCVHGDALVLLKTCANHLVNGTYLEHRFIVNGVDIAHDLSDSIIAFEKKDFHRFGADIGISLRKLLLSKALNATRLPEGVPDQVIIQKATDGLMRGFFVSGSSVEITDTAHPDIDVNIDLHRCIAGNEPFFKELWMAAWDLIAQLSVNAKEHGLQGAFQSLGQEQKNGQPKWSGELMIAMMQFPSALMRCGLSEDMQDTFMEAIKTLGQLQIQFHIPNQQGVGFGAKDQAKEVSEKMARAVEAWTQWDFEKFGYELGELFRDLVMLAMPQKYSVRDGRLHRYSESLTSPIARKASAVSGSVVIIGGFAMTTFVAFAAIRTRRSVPALLQDRQLLTEQTDLEDGDALESVE